MLYFNYFQEIRKAKKNFTKKIDIKSLIKKYQENIILNNDNSLETLLHFYQNLSSLGIERKLNFLNKTAISVLTYYTLKLN